MATAEKNLKQIFGMNLKISSLIMMEVLKMIKIGLKRRIISITQILTTMDI
jgi:hypothetical protein